MTTLSRRTILGLGAVAAGAALGVTGWEAARSLFSTAVADTPDAEKKAPPPSAIIDVHVHLVHTNLAGVPTKRLTGGDIFPAKPEDVARVLQAEMKSASVTHILAMPRREPGDADPLGVAFNRAVARIVPGVHPVGFADPERFDDGHLERVEADLKKGDVKAFKAYLGYVHRGPSDPGYRPYYKLAGKYGIPVILHTGDTFSQQAKLKFAHPLQVDEVAVDYPETKFVIAHLGNPWLIDAAQVLYKNNKKGLRENVHADLSGLLVGSAETFAAYRLGGVLKSVAADVRKAFDYAERPEAFLYGSDWPLAPMAAYRDLIREAIPTDYHQAVFHDNAKKLFNLK